MNPLHVQSRSQTPHAPPAPPLLLEEDVLEPELLLLELPDEELELEEVEPPPEEEEEEPPPEEEDVELEPDEPLEEPLDEDPLAEPPSSSNPVVGGGIAAEVSSACWSADGGSAPPAPVAHAVASITQGMRSRTMPHTAAPKDVFPVRRVGDDASRHRSPRRKREDPRALGVRAASRPPRTTLGRMTLLHSALTALLALSVAACSGAANEATSGPSTSTAPTTDATDGDANREGEEPADAGVAPTADSSTDADASTSPGSGLLPPSTPKNMILISQSTANGSAFFSSATAGFEPDVPPTSSACTSLIVAGCSVIDCNLAAPSPTGQSAPSAGTITFSGPASVDLGLMLTPTPQGRYEDAKREARVFAPGDLLSISAAGGDIPAFTGTVIAPSDIALISPKVVFPTKLVVDRTKDLATTWSGGGTSVVSVILATSRVTGGKPARGVYVSCEALASGGALTVPAAAVAKLEPTGTDVSGFVGINTYNESAIVAGSRTIALRASSSTTLAMFFETVN